MSTTYSITKPNLQIAIDGPVAAGKGTVSKLLAEELGILYVDTGAMYRALCYFAVQRQIDFNIEALLCEQLEIHKPQVMLKTPENGEKDGRLITVLLDDEDISWQIRTEKISRAVSIITRYKCVRDYLVPQQQKLADSTSVVMEGRDITTRVLPQADLKIYMDASEDIRATRRHQQLMEKGEMRTIDEVKKDLAERDHRDMNRTLDPLTKAADAWHLDTSELTLPQVVDVICERLKEQGLIA